jgi:hypothetical protein
VPLRIGGRVPILRSERLCLLLNGRGVERLVNRTVSGRWICGMSNVERGNVSSFQLPIRHDC